MTIRDTFDFSMTHKMRFRLDRTRRTKEDLQSVISLVHVSIDGIEDVIEGLDELRDALGNLGEGEGSVVRKLISKVHSVVETTEFKGERPLRGFVKKVPKGSNKGDGMEDIVFPGIHSELERLSSEKGNLKTCIDEVSRVSDDRLKMLSTISKKLEGMLEVTIRIEQGEQDVCREIDALNSASSLLGSTRCDIVKSARVAMRAQANLTRERILELTI
jgi:hypothetical protein